MRDAIKPRAALLAPVSDGEMDITRSTGIRQRRASNWREPTSQRNTGAICSTKWKSTEERPREERGDESRVRRQQLNVSSSGSAAAKPVRIAW